MNDRRTGLKPVLDQTQKIIEQNKDSMKYSEASQGRVFIVRLEDGEILHASLEKFAVEKNIRRAAVQALGGADKGSKLVVGPQDGRARQIVPMDHVLNDVYEIAGFGTIFPDAADKPVLHMHIACGRDGHTLTGCVRRGIRVWQVMEVIIIELVNATSRRVLEKESGFELLQP
jgi:predicted DNA-binding protein with PD1-like motif